MLFCVLNSKFTLLIQKNFSWCCLFWFSGTHLYLFVENAQKSDCVKWKGQKRTLFTRQPRQQECCCNSRNQATDTVPSFRPCWSGSLHLRQEIYLFRSDDMSIWLLTCCVTLQEYPRTERRGCSIQRIATDKRCKHLFPSRLCTQQTFQRDNLVSITKYFSHCLGSTIEWIYLFNETRIDVTYVLVPVLKIQNKNCKKNCAAPVFPGKFYLTTCVTRASCLIFFSN